ncbi:MAG: Ribulose-5-phosphate 4-epimerase/Fuculose-phosphate aldolase [Acidimicrobiales bacterium]|nr:Ribulose-5-phosphate 4-epimerase/Fuculose-phosphate aldolase [Acidimicrobiales bacterium]
MSDTSRSMTELRRSGSIVEGATARPAPVPEGVTPSQGGLDAWSPRVTPPIGIDLTDEQTLACAFRILAECAFSENIAGHITWVRDDRGTMLVNPWGLWWEEVKASDLCVVTADAEFVAGRWDVTPAIHIHTEIHRADPRARVVAHNHPYHATVLAALGLLPDIFHQTGTMFDGDLGFVAEYAGEIDSRELGADLAQRIGDASVVVLANHGVIVTGPTVEEVTYRAASFDRQCRLAYDLLVAGRAATTVTPDVRGAMKASLLERGTDVFWAGAVRRLLRTQPEVMD